MTDFATSTTRQGSGMRATLLILATVLVLSGSAFFYRFLYAAVPTTSQRIKFERFIMLPRHGAANFLDYLTLSGSNRFIGGVSSGSVFKVALSAVPDRESSVTELTGMPSVHGIGILPSQDTGFVTRSGENTVDIIDPRTLDLRRRIPVAPGPDALLFDSRDDLLYVANSDAGIAALFDSTGSIVGTISLGGTAEFAVYNPKDGLVYQNIEDTQSIVALDLKARKVVGTWKIDRCDSPRGLALDELRQRLFAVCGGNAILMIFDVANHRIVASVSIGSRPDSAVYDPALRRIYCGGGLGTLTTVQQEDADVYRVLDLIPTRLGAHTLAVDSDSHKLYVGYAGFFRPSSRRLLDPPLTNECSASWAKSFYRAGRLAFFTNRPSLVKSGIEWGSSRNREKSCRSPEPAEI